LFLLGSGQNVNAVEKPISAVAGASARRFALLVNRLRYWRFIAVRNRSCIVTI
jgi:hypothetical protein